MKVHLSYQHNDQHMTQSCWPFGISCNSIPSNERSGDSLMRTRKAMSSTKVEMFLESDSFPAAKQPPHKNADKNIITPASKKSTPVVQSRNGDLTRRTLVPYHFTPRGQTQ